MITLAASMEKGGLGDKQVDRQGWVLLRKVGSVMNYLVLLFLDEGFYRASSRSRGINQQKGEIHIAKDRGRETTDRKRRE